MKLPADHDWNDLGEPEFWTEVPAGDALCFAPHPDDEVIGPGGALGLHAARGDRVRVVIATDGRSGDPERRFSASPEQLAEIRRAESAAGLAELGVHDAIHWGMPDGHRLTEADIEGLVRRICAECEAFDPGVVYLPWPGERHGDHRALSVAVVRALRRIDFGGLIFGYEVWTPMTAEIVLDLAPIAAAKRAAIARYESQVGYADYERTIFGLHAYRSLLLKHGVGEFEAYCRMQLD